MMSGHGTNPIFLNKNNKDWMSRILATPHPAMSDNISFLSYPHLKVEVIYVSPLKMKQKFLIKQETYYNRLFESK